MDCKYLSALLLLGLSTGLAVGEDAPNIINGTDADDYEFPYQVGIKGFNRRTVTNCGGSLIALDTVLTAAHCFMKMNSDKFYDARIYKVYAGTNDLKDYRKSLIINVAKVYVHAAYKVYLTEEGAFHRSINDIAILKLKEGFPADTQGIDTIYLPEPYENFKDRVGTVSGYGYNLIEEKQSQTYPYGWYLEGKSDDKLHSLNMTILSDANCDYSDVHICASTSGIWSGTCQGDSGSPLVVNRKVVGVVSYGPQICDNTRFKAHFTKVTAFLDWIQDCINDKHPTLYNKYDVEQEYYKSLNPIRTDRPPVAQQPPAIRTTTKPSTEYEEPIRSPPSESVEPSPQFIQTAIERYKREIEILEHLFNQSSFRYKNHIQEWNEILKNFKFKLSQTVFNSEKEKLEFYIHSYRELYHEYKRLTN